MREVFKLVGKITIDGIDSAKKSLDEFDANAKQISKSLNRAGRSATDFGLTLTKSITVPLVAVATAAYGAVGAASDLNEAVSMTGQVFGSSAKEIETWASKADESIGQSKKQAMEAASTFAIFGKSAGLAGGDLVGFSKQFTELASDLASFKNTSPEQAVTAIGAAFRGESEPMRQYGVLLDDASLRQKALEMGIVSTTKDALTPQQKVLAASALIMDQTKVAQGNFALTSKDLANQQRILAAQTANMSAELGTIFLPIALSVVGVFKDSLLPAIKGAVGWFKELSPETQKTVLILAALAAGLGPTIILIGKLSSVGAVLVPILLQLATGQLALNKAMSMNLIGVVVTAIFALIAAGVLLKNNWSTISAYYAIAMENMTYVASNAFSSMKISVMQGVQAYLEAYSKIAQFIPGLGQLIDAAKDKMSNMITEEQAAKAQRQKEHIDKLAEAKRQLAAATNGAAEANKQEAETQENNKRLLDEQTASAFALSEKRKEFEAGWTSKLQEQTLARTELLEIEKQAALLKAEELGANKQVIIDYYKSLEDQKALEWQQKAAEAKMTEQEKLTAEMERELLQVGNNEAAKQAVRDYYATKQKELHDNETEAKNSAYDKQAESLMGYVDKVASGEAKMGDIIKGALVKQLEAMQKSALAELLKGVATAWAQAPATFGASLSWIPPLLMQKGLAIAGIQAAKSRIQALADGGKTQGATFAMIGEGKYDEAVLPLSAEVFSELGQGIAASLVNMLPRQEAATQTQSTGGGTTVNLNVGTLVADDSGIKKLMREIEKFRYIENTRVGAVNG